MPPDLLNTHPVQTSHEADHPLSRPLKVLQQLLAMPVVVYASTPGPFKPIEEADLDVMHACLTGAIGSDRRVALVLQTAGGYVNAARHLAVRLRETVRTLHIVVPHKAISAGTLLCLAAEELVLGVRAELSPLDPNVSAAQPQPGMPASISSADIHAYLDMAEQWFGLDRKRDGLELFKLLNQKFFPTSLSSFFRSEQQMLSYCQHFLQYSRPTATPEERADIASRLVQGYSSHDYVITRAEASELGLPVRIPSPDEEQAATAVLRACRTLRFDGEPPRLYNAVIASDVFLATHEQRDSFEGHPAFDATPDHELDPPMAWRVRT